MKIFKEESESNPYDDNIRSRYSKVNGSDSKLKSRSQLSQSLNYSLLKKDIGTMFDVMKLDKSVL